MPGHDFVEDLELALRYDPSPLSRVMERVAADLLLMRGLPGTKEEFLSELLGQDASSQGAVRVSVKFPSKRRASIWSFLCKLADSLYASQNRITLREAKRIIAGVARDELKIVHSHLILQQKAAYQKLARAVVWSREQWVDEPMPAPGRHHFLLACADGRGPFSGPQLEVLRLLLSQRDVWSGWSLWRQKGEPPAESALNQLLGLVSDLAWETYPGTVIPGRLLAIAKELACELRGSALLQSPSYRMMLWDALNSMIYRELLRCKYESLFPRLRFPVESTASSLLLDVWLVAEYGYVLLGVDREFGIYERFERAMGHELMLYYGKEGYRDHLQHSLNTFLLGHALMSPTGALCPNAKRRKATELGRDWLVASLFHDFGYVMDLLPVMFGCARRFDSRSVEGIIGNLESEWTREVENLNRQVGEDCGIQAEATQRCDHGVFSYVQLRNLLLQMDWGIAPNPDKIEKECQSPQCKKYCSALTAVLVHNMPRQPIRMKGKDGNMVAGALVLCDEIQDWDRPRYREQDLTMAGVSMAHFQSAVNVSDRQTTQRVDIHFSGKLRTTRVVVHFAEQNSNMFDPVCRLIGALHNWERIEDLAGLPMMVEFRIHSLSSKGRSEIEILREFCLIGGTAWVSPELHSAVSSSQRTKRRCSYYQDTPASSGETFDVIVVNFAKFEPKQRRSNPLIKRPSWDIEDAFRRFKRDYCQEHGIECSYLSGDPLWAISRTADPLP